MTRTMKTKPQRWNEIARAAVILGIVDDLSRGSMYHVNGILKRRESEGKVIKIKTGPAQSSPTFYIGKHKGSGR